MVRVLRLKPGDTILLNNEAGLQYTARIVAAKSDYVEAVVMALEAAPVESILDVTVALGFLKEKKMDTLVRQLTELGTTRFMPFFAERSIARPSEDRLAARYERWEKIAREALKQCRARHVPVIHPAVRLDEAIASSRGSDLKIVFWEEAVDPIPENSGLSASGGTVFLMLGPEGGLSRQEVQAAKAAGFTVCTLGPRILRAETAAITACSLVQYLWGDLRYRSVTERL